MTRIKGLESGEHIEIRAVLAGAYRGKRIDDRTLLTHAVICTDGRDRQTLCRSVPIDSMCDQIESGPVSCPKCTERLTRILGAHPSTIVIMA